MRIYVAGSWAQRGLLKAAHDYVRKAGLTVVSTWPEQADREYTDEEKTGLAQQDWAELLHADTLIYCRFNGGVISEGKATELGGALATNMRIILVGTREHNVFLHLPQVEQFASLGEAVHALLEG